jgi:hypothetical protein
MMNRALSNSDQIASSIATIKEQSIETNGTVKLIQQAQEAQSRAISDHEARMRVLERANSRSN